MNDNGVKQQAEFVLVRLFQAASSGSKDKFLHRFLKFLIGNIGLFQPADLSGNDRKFRVKYTVKKSHYSLSGLTIFFQQRNSILVISGDIN